MIWVSPFLKPESTLLGMALALGMWSRLPVLAIAIMGFGSLLIFVRLPSIYGVDLATMLLYPSAALICGSLFLLTLRVGVINRVMTWTPIVYLGKISFGLYVFHIFAIKIVAPNIMPQLFLNQSWAWFLGRTALILALTIAMASASYFLFEQWFLRLKVRFSAVESRPI